MNAKKFPITVTAGGVSAKIRKVSQTKNGKEYPLYIADYVLLGKRRQEGRAKFEDAKEVALNACRLIASGQQASLSLVNGARLEYLRATEALSPVFVKLDVAAHEYANAVTLLGGRATITEACRDWLRRYAAPLPKITVPDAVTMIKGHAKTDGKSEARLKQLANVLDRFARDMNVQVHTLEPNIISKYLAALPLGERSKRNHRDVLGFFFRWLILKGYLPKGADLLEGVQNYSARKIGEIEIYTPDELARLIAHADDAMLPFIVIQAFAGLRHAEVARLDWSEIDLDDGYIEVVAAKSKTGERRLVPMHDNLKAWLLLHRQPRGKVCPYVNTAKQLLKIAKSTGQPAEEGSPAFPALKWKHNGLRHSFISYRVAESGDVPRTSDEAGNSVAVIRGHYLRRVKPAEAARWFSIMPLEKEQEKIIDLKTAIA